MGHNIFSPVSATSLLAYHSLIKFLQSSVLNTFELLNSANIYTTSTQVRTQPLEFPLNWNTPRLLLKDTFEIIKKHRNNSKMPTATRVMLSRALKRALPRQQLLLPQQRGLAAHVDDKTTRPSDQHPAHEVPKNVSFNTHHPVSTSVSWGEEFWRNIPVYSDVTSQEFLSYRWSVSKVSSMPNSLISTFLSIAID